MILTTLVYKIEKKIKALEAADEAQAEKNMELEEADAAAEEMLKAGKMKIEELEMAGMAADEKIMALEEKV